MIFNNCGHRANDQNGRAFQSKPAGVVTHAHQITAALALFWQRGILDHRHWHIRRHPAGQQLIADLVQFGHPHVDHQCRPALRQRLPVQLAIVLGMRGHQRHPARYAAQRQRNIALCRASKAGGNAVDQLDLNPTFA